MSRALESYIPWHNLTSFELIYAGLYPALNNDVFVLNYKIVLFFRHIDFTIHF